ncbi:AraC family transcriptional regulator [Amycolatopsis sp. OK19-0408]|uniref:AraC family transcriptional regulator n=1 Tax=Amycolatopsis iheyensis TaxID=2945988 RepID=A0A9X2NDZ9_9PSEU|nr:AraC family transcriptional regulator [Amycolatopsis iheyensis]MCR6485953.1 AraC family transcriptional regulator [Amycolatopsis iheyensis]
MCIGLTAAAHEHFRELTLLRRVRDHIDRNHACPLDLDALAQTVNLPTPRFVDRFMQAYGLSPQDYHRRARVPAEHLIPEPR